MAKLRWYKAVASTAGAVNSMQRACRASNCPTNRSSAPAMLLYHRRGPREQRGAFVKPTPQPEKHQQASCD